MFDNVNSMHQNRHIVWINDLNVYKNATYLLYMLLIGNCEHG